MEAPAIKTQRLILRSWNVDDTDRLWEILQEPGILEYFPPMKPSREGVGRYINRHLGYWNDFHYGHWAVTLKDNNQVIGWCGLEFLPETNETEVAYLLCHSAWGRGIASEAAKEAVAYGMNTVKLDGIVGLTDPRNIASQRVLEKCGLVFVEEKEYFGMLMRRYWLDNTEDRS
jgi:ribosomal-protein-alanine N-acetyltransferase